MTKRLAIALVAGSLFGCATGDILRPPIPAAPPTESVTIKSTSKPLGSVNANSLSRGLDKGEETKARGPVTPSQVTEQTAGDIAKALEAELEDDAANAPQKP